MTLPRWPRYVIPAVIIVVVAAILISVIAGIWTDYLWFSSVGQTGVFATTYSTKWLLFIVTAVLMTAIIGANIWVAYRCRPKDPPSRPENQGVEAYRQAIDPHRRGVTDPMSAALANVAGSADPVSPDACDRKIAIFDGRMRYDLRLAYKRMETVRATRGYQGPAVVCAVYFVPIAGYIPQRSAIKYLVAQRDIEAWLAPVAGTRVVVPYRVSVPTPLGLGIMEATDFVTEAQRSRESAFNAKVQ